MYSSVYGTEFRCLHNGAMQLWFNECCMRIKLFGGCAGYRIQISASCAIHTLGAPNTACTSGTMVLVHGTGRRSLHISAMHSSVASIAADLASIMAFMRCLKFGPLHTSALHNPGAPNVAYTASNMVSMHCYDSVQY